MLLRCLAAGDAMAMRRRSDIRMGLTGIFGNEKMSKLEFHDIDRMGGKRV